MSKIRARALCSNWNLFFYGGPKDTLSKLGQLATREILRIFKDDNIMQFTGIIDKNGKEIYEGDIVHFINDEDGLNRKITGLKNGCFRYENSMGCIPFNEWSEEERSTLVEVIGNVYGNPELLK